MSTDSLDIEDFNALLIYLRDTGRLDRAETPLFRNLAGGVSNRTVLVERASGESWVLKQALAKLRVKVDWYSDPARIHREALGLKWLEKLAPPGTITPLIFEDESQHLLAMQAVPKPHENWKTMLLRGDIRMEHFEQFGHLIGTIHQRSYERRKELQPIFSDRSFFESLRIEPYYLYTATQVPEATEFMNGSANVNRQRGGMTLVHGDYSPKNILIDPKGRLVLLDHEVIHWGDPAFDLGFALAHLLSKAHHLRELRKQMLDGAMVVWKTYRAATGDKAWTPYLQPMVVAETLACLLARVAGRSQLEYLSDQERKVQRDVVVEFVHGEQTPLFHELLREFPKRLAAHGH